VYIVFSFGGICRKSTRNGTGYNKNPVWWPRLGHHFQDSSHGNFVS